MLRRTIDVAPVRVGDVTRREVEAARKERQEDIRTAQLRSALIKLERELKLTSPGSQAENDLKREAKRLKGLLGAKDRVTLEPVPVSGERELRYTARDEDPRRDCKVEFWERGAWREIGVYQYSEAVQIIKRLLKEYGDPNRVRMKAVVPVKDALQPVPVSGEFPLVTEPRRGKDVERGPDCRWCGQGPLIWWNEKWQHTTRQAQKECPHPLPFKDQMPAKDSSLSTGLLAALIAAIVAHFYGPDKTVGPQDYDLTRYRPKRREW